MTACTLHAHALFMGRAALVIISLLIGLAGPQFADAKPKRLAPQKEAHRAPERLARRDDGLVAEPKGITWIVRPGPPSKSAVGARRVAQAKAPARAVKQVAQRGNAASRAGRVARGRAR